MSVKPYKKSGDKKKQQVEQMFDNIAHRYDFLNHFLSMGIDKLWRKKAIRILSAHPHRTILDVATGTGDFAIEALKINPESITGFDLSQKMMNIGKDKVEKIGCSDRIKFIKGDSEDMPFEDENFDAITAGFGVRNFENLEAGLKEFYRVLNNQGVAIILEFSKPKAFPMKQLYNFYFFKILPLFGKSISKDSSAYSYLPESVMAFPDGNQFLALLSKVGFKRTEQHRLTGGIATIYVAQK